MTIWTITHQAPLSMGFSRQEYCSGLPCPPPRDLPNPGIKPMSLAFLHWQVGSLPLAPPRSPMFKVLLLFNHSVVSDSVTPWTVTCQASFSFTISQSVLKFTLIESVMPSNYLVLCRPLPFLPSIFSSFRVFSNELALPIRWPKYWSFSFSISPSNEYSGLISFRIN